MISILQKERLMLRQTESLSQGHEANEVMELGFKPQVQREGMEENGDTPLLQGESS